MGTSSEKVTTEADIEDDLPEEESPDLKAFRERAAARQKKKDEEEMPARIVGGRKRSLEFGVVGSGQAGSRLAQTFAKRGYSAVAVNTATQDLENIDLPEERKLHLDFGLGGAGKELTIGHEAAEAHRSAITQLVRQTMDDCEVLLFCCSLGGGSGAGSAEVMVDILSEMERPVAVVTVLPMAHEDGQTKENALATLSKFTKMIQAGKIANCIVVDNARIEAMYSDVGTLNFFSVSNEAIVEPLDALNCLTAQAVEGSAMAVDSTDFGKIFTDGLGLTVYGRLRIQDYQDEYALADAVMDSLKSTLLASGFNLKQSRYACVLFAASQKVWDKIPSASVNYAGTMVDDVCGPSGSFQSVHVIDDEEDAVIVYTMFSGLGLPEDRINQLKADAKARGARAAEKDEQRDLTLKLDVEEETVSAADAIKKKIAAKKSAFSGKLHRRAVDRRK